MRGPDTTRKELVQTWLTTEVHFVLGDLHAKLIEPHKEAIGNHLYRIHKEMLYNYVAARVDAHKEALASVKAFLEKYDVDEDEFSVETGYRLYKRWRDYFEKVSMTNGIETVPNLSWVTERVPMTLNQASQVVKRVDEFIDQGGLKVPKNTRLGIRGYILYTYTDLTLRKLAVQSKRKFQNIHNSINSARSLLEHHPELERWIKYCVATTEVRATP